MNACAVGTGAIHLNTKMSVSKFQPFGKFTRLRTERNDETPPCGKDFRS
jgi:hypothetical protein